MLEDYFIRIKYLDDTYDEVYLVDSNLNTVYPENRECLKIDRISSVFRTKKSIKKIEFLNDKYCFVVSSYVEIDNKPFVLTLISRINGNVLNKNLMSQINELIEYVESDNSGSLGDDIKIQIKKLRSKIYIDDMTGVYNRKYYEEKVKNNFGIHTIAVIDFDNFKQVNDVYGHLIGDRLIIDGINEIKNGLTKADKLIRIGGDEFLIVFESNDLDNVVKRLEKIKNKVNKLRTIPNFVIGISVGVTQGAMVMHDLVDIADKTMYDSKKQKNSVSVTVPK